MNAMFLLELARPEINLALILPEIIVAATAALIMLVDCFMPRQKAVTGALAMAGLAAAFVSTLWLWSSGTNTAENFNGMVAFDTLRFTFTLVSLVITALTLLISVIWTDREDVPVGEYHALMMFSTVGMLLMASGNDFIIMFLGLETLSIATYVLAGLRRTDLRSNESALKYFILGSFASAFLLYGMALVYGATRSTNITAISEAIAQNRLEFPALLLIGGALMIIGFGFKVASAPFHVWTPDVYEGAPSVVTGFMASGPKTAAFASFLRVFLIGFPILSVAATATNVSLTNAWSNALAVMAVLSMIIGNAAAIVQNNVKRMLSYSSISHAGYVLVGFVAAAASQTMEERNEVISAVAFYMLAYSLTTLGAFTVVTLVSRKGDRRTEFEDFNGIGFKSPVLAFSLSLFMLSFLGLPLTAGFMGKVAVFAPAARAGYYILLVLAVINSAVSAYYYLRLIVVMFFRERISQWIEPKVSAGVSLVLVITVLGVLYLGIFPDSVLNVFRRQPNAVAQR